MPIIFSIKSKQPVVPQKTSFCGTTPPAAEKGGYKRRKYQLPDGISYHKRTRKYVARVYEKQNGRRITKWLGSFSTVKSAELAIALARINPVPTHEQIAARAYQLYVDRGYVDGFAEQDWVTACLQLKLIEESGNA